MAHIHDRAAFLRGLSADWDGEGAPAAVGPSLDDALAFAECHLMQSWAPALTLDAQGFAVLEADGPNGSFISVSFLPDAAVAVYWRPAGQPSAYFVGDADSAAAFLASEAAA